MSRLEKHAYLTVEEFLAKEEGARIKHEYVDGCVYAMTGVTRRHSAIAVNISSFLHSRLRGGKCSVFVSDVKARVETTNSIYYPDVMVSCTGRNDESLFAESPVLVVEVLSRSTMMIDRREKLYAYRQIPSLLEYIIVYQSKQRVEMHRKNSSGLWDVFVFGAGDELVLESVGKLKLPLADIYEGIDLDQGPGLQVREETAEWGDESGEQWDY